MSWLVTETLWACPACSYNGYAVVVVRGAVMTLQCTRCGQDNGWPKYNGYRLVIVVDPLLRRRL